jgi:hypothetical protein
MRAKAEKLQIKKNLSPSNGFAKLAATGWGAAVLAFWRGDEGDASEFHKYRIDSSLGGGLAEEKMAQRLL